MTDPRPTDAMLYAARDLPRLEPHYSRHVCAMTAEGLHSKSDIAAELAFRDSAAESLRAENLRLLAVVQAARTDHDDQMCKLFDEELAPSSLALRVALRALGPLNEPEPALPRHRRGSKGTP